MARTRPCTAALIEGRRRKAEQFLADAEAIRELADDEAASGDSYVTLCTHAGIAAADVLCCRALGVHAQGESHGDAVDLLGSLRPDGPKHAKALGTLLAMKTRAGYSDRPVTAEQRRRAGRAAHQLVDALAS
jgi:hypothetical protein